MYVVFVLALLTSLAEGFGITLLLPLLKVTEKNTMDQEMGTAEEVLHSLLSWMGIADSVVGILAFIALVFLGKGLLTFGKSAYTTYLRSQLYKEVKMKLFDAFNSMKYRYYIRESTGHFVNVIGTQTGTFVVNFLSVVGLFTGMIMTTGYFAFAFTMTWRFTLMALGIGGVMLYLFRWLNDYVKDISRQKSKEHSHFGKMLIQSLQSFKYVLATNQVDHLRSGVKKSLGRLKRYQIQEGIASAFTSSLKEPVIVLFITVIIAIQVLVFQDPLAPIFVTLVLFNRGLMSLLSIQSSWQGIMGNAGAVEMVVEEFEKAKNHEEDDGERRIGPLSEGIDFQNVCYAYNEEDGDVLHDIDISIPVNTTVALVGESGAGKSTLVDMLTLMLRPRTGKIEIDGVPAEEIKRESWRSQIGYVSQETVVFDDTVANNICLWQGDVDNDPALRERVRDAAQRAHADHCIRELPNGYQTVVGEQGVRLSGGQRQRLFVARELFKNPNLLLLDEATSDLDTASEQHIQDSIDALQGEVTVVIIAHRLSTVKNADRVFVLDDGRVVEEGSYHELRMREGGQFREMVEMQSL